jgi:protein-L-isoaspartate(D-aspartate) O-methyltransferase
MARNANADQLRQDLVEHLRARGVLADQRVAAAFAEVPRHRFLPGTPLEKVYSDAAIPIKSDDQGIVVSSSSQPRMMAIMLNQAGVQPGHNVLEIGTATGYNAAITQHIVGDAGSVTSLEIDNDLSRQATKNLHSAGYSMVKVVQVDAAAGYAPRASYDRILSTVGVWDVPEQWLQQLKPDGVLVVPIAMDGVQASAAFKPQPDGTFLSVDNQPCGFVQLRGEGTGPNTMMRVGTTALHLMADDLHKIDSAALHMLLSDDQGLCHLETVIEHFDDWYGFQLYLMLNEPSGYIFAVYVVPEGRKPYGMEYSGMALFAPASAAFAAFQDRGNVHCFAGADAVLAMQEKVDEWKAIGRPRAQELRMRLIPRAQGEPQLEHIEQLKRGKVYERRQHYLHVWLEENTTT